MQPGSNLGGLLAARRQELGLSQAELARRVGVNKSTILRLERGHIVTPSPATCARLARALQLPVSALTIWAGHRLPPLREYLQATYGPLPDDIVLSIERQLDDAVAVRSE
jgi:transcriptional regulator with XRE-family HTH domain